MDRPSPAPTARFTARALAGLVAVLAAGACFGLLLALVRLHWLPLDRLDRGAAAALNRVVSEHPLAIRALQTITDLGGPLFVTVLVAATAIGLLGWRRMHLAAYLAVTALGATILSPTLKMLVGRLRPVVAEPVATATGNSFPSGHALASTICYGALLLVFLPLVPRRGRPAVIGFVCVLVAAIGFTRIALGVHYVSDVLAGWLLGVTWLGLTAYAFRLWLREAGRPVPPGSVGLAPAEGSEGSAPEVGLRPVPTAGVDRPHLARAAAVLGVAWVLLLGVLFFLAALVPGRPSAGLAGSGFAGRVGDAPAILAVALVAAVLAVVVTRSWRPAGFIAVALVGQLGVVLTVNQARHTTFPDGRVAATAALYGAIAVLVVTGTRRWWRWIAALAAVLAPVLVAWAQLSQGGQRPVDVAGGALLALAWLAATALVQRPWTPVPVGPSAA
jgi:undecaprenyl-diphosphatase